jgi:hypothetical protein
MWLVVLQRVTIDFFVDFVVAPVWWYTAGLLRAGRFCLSLVQQANGMFVPGLWARNMFVPMFGQTDFQGRMMSVLMRTVNMIIRGLLLFFWLIIVLFVFLLWVVIPPFVAVMWVRSLF